MHPFLNQSHDETPQGPSAFGGDPVELNEGKPTGGANEANQPATPAPNPREEVNPPSPGPANDSGPAYAPENVELDPTPEPPKFNGIVKLAMGAVVAVGIAFGVQKISPRFASADWHDDLDAAAVEASETGKPVLVYFTADWCGGCTRFKKEVLNRGEVRERMESDFILARIDLSERGGPNDVLASEFAIRSIPRVLMFDSSGQLVAQTQGMDPNSMLRWFDENQPR